MRCFALHRGSKAKAAQAEATRVLAAKSQMGHLLVDEGSESLRTGVYREKEQRRSLRGQLLKTLKSRLPNITYGAFDSYPNIQHGVRVKIA